MIAGEHKTGTLANSIMSGRCFEPLSVTTRDGRPARIAIIDDQGCIIDAGDAVAKEAWNVMVAVYKNYLVGQGHVRVFGGENALGQEPCAVVCARSPAPTGSAS